jgi:hypothetical protein
MPLATRLIFQDWVPYITNVRDVVFQIEYFAEHYFENYQTRTHVKQIEVDKICQQKSLLFYMLIEWEAEVKISGACIAFAKRRA